MREFFQEHKNDVRLYDRIFDNCHWNGNAISLFYRNMQQFIPEQIYNFRIPDASGYVQVEDVKIEDKIYGDETVPFIAFPQRDFLEEKTKQFFGKERTGWWEGRFFINMLFMVNCFKKLSIIEKSI